MALKKYTRSVTVITQSDKFRFTGDDGFAAYNALVKREQIMATGTVSEEGGTSKSGTFIIPYHAVMAALVDNGSVDAEMAQDDMCPTSEDTAS